MHLRTQKGEATKFHHTYKEQKVANLEEKGDHTYKEKKLADLEEKGIVR